METVEINCNCGNKFTITTKMESLPIPGIFCGECEKQYYIMEIEGEISVQ